MENMEVDSGRQTSLTKHQLEFLRPFILRKRNKDNTTNDKVISQTSDHIPKMREGFIKREKDPEPMDIAEQIEILQKHLERLKKEKHNLFHQLKLVLHDEDEKKKAEEQKLEYDKGTQPGDVFTPRPQRPFITSMLSSTYPGGPSRQPRVPLLPTPEGGSTSFTRQNSAGSFFVGSEVFPQNKTMMLPRAPTMAPVSRPPYADKRLGPTYPGSMPPDGVHMPAPHGNQAAQPSAGPGSFTHLGPEVSHHYPPGPNFQYQHGMSSFNVRAPGPPASNPPVQMLYAQGGSFMQSQDMHFNQPLPPMHHIYAGAVTSPHAPGGHTHGDHSTTSPIVHDPRHQKPPGS